MLANVLKNAAKKLLKRWYFRLVIPIKFSCGRKNGVLLIYQMGKVGSKAIEASISEQKLKMPIFHVHVLSTTGIKNGELYRRSMLNDNYDYYGNIVLQREILNCKHKLKVISLVREPVARNISAFFENSDLWTSPDSQTVDPGYDTMQEFLDKFDHSKPLVWFDNEIDAILGIDVYSEPFPIERGYNIYRRDHIELLLIRQESLSSCFQHAMKDFLGIDRATLAASNRAESKDYANDYKNFKNNIFSKDYLEWMYSSKYAKHFYADSEIQSFKNKWGTANKEPHVEQVSKQ